MSECTHTHMFWARLIRTCPRCGVSYAPDNRSLVQRLGGPADLSVDDVKAFFDLPDDDDTMHSERRVK